MLLSIDPAARKLGKAAHQVRYLIQLQTLTAHKVGGRWLIHSDDLSLSGGQQQAIERNEQPLRHAVRSLQA